jgi:hypothetical protein
MRAGLLLAISVLAGCLGDIVPLYQRVEGDGGSESVSGDPDLAQPQDPAADMGGGGADLDCVPKSAALGDGHHNPGLNCMTCHDGNTAGAPKYFVAGTLYDSVAGTNPVAGATIQITQGAMKVNLQSQENGNFFTETPVTFPFQTRATGSPTRTPMISAVTATGGSCNQAACHDTAINRIHLP